jgi:hypothetical protein
VLMTKIRVMRRGDKCHPPPSINAEVDAAMLKEPSTSEDAGSCVRIERVLDSQRRDKGPYSVCHSTQSNGDVYYATFMSALPNTSSLVFLCTSNVGIPHRSTTATVRLACNVIRNDTNRFCD